LGMARTMILWLSFNGARAAVAVQTAILFD
jgi:hypothetical protein